MNQEGRNRAVRFRLSLIMLLGLIGALGSFWVLEVMRKQDAARAPQIRRSESDYQVEKFHFVRTAANGQAHYLLSGERLLHHPIDDSVDIISPVAQNINPDTAPVTVRADAARLLEDNQHVLLVGNVHVTRPASGQSQALLINTPSLLIKTESDTMQTDDAVVITLGQSILTGTGMLANSGTGLFQLSHQVHGVLRPNPGTSAAAGTSPAHQPGTAP